MSLIRYSIFRGRNPFPDKKVEASFGQEEKPVKLIILKDGIFVDEKQF
jgi:hypothetical protein